METIGKLLGGNKVELDITENGFCYKSLRAFENKKGICYIPEHGVSGCDEIELSYTYKDLYSTVENYVKGLNYSDSEIENLTKGVFDLLDWQVPETLLEDLSL